MCPAGNWFATLLSSSNNVYCVPVGDQGWRQILVEGIDPAKRQFLTGYLCASLYYLLDDPSSRMAMFGDDKAGEAVVGAVLTAALSSESLVRLANLSKCMQDSLATCHDIWICALTPALASRECAAWS